MTKNEMFAHEHLITYIIRATRLVEYNVQCEYKETNDFLYHCANHVYASIRQCNYK